MSYIIFKYKKIMHRKGELNFTFSIAKLLNFSYIKMLSFYFFEKHFDDVRLNLASSLVR